MENYRTFCPVCLKYVHMGDLVTCGKAAECGLKTNPPIEEIPVDFDRTNSTKEVDYRDILRAAQQFQPDLKGISDTQTVPLVQTVASQAPDDSLEAATQAFLPAMVNEQAGPDFGRPEAAEYPDDNPKTVLGLSKPSFTAIPPVALIHLGRAMSDGRRKYGLMNWREKTVTTSVYVDAALRHLMAFWDGEDQAQDSLVEHLGHVMACCAIVLDAASTGKLNDDRPVPGKFSETVASLTKASS